MSNPTEFLWYIPNQIEGGHRGDVIDGDPSSLDTLTRHAVALEEHGWKGALLGTSWGRPDTSPWRPRSPREPEPLNR
ncbi:hypothetical protein ACM61V_15410 [Sphingomonas sp. TX0543]|uniref:hypothetical protein n=1 Tax=Sphingomonas sp. TX0543 TaxID=3399682 RepID=UPI003AFAA35B